MIKHNFFTKGRKFKQTQSAQKIMATVFWWCLLVYFMEMGITMTAKCTVKHFQSLACNSEPTMWHANVRNFSHS